MLRQAAAAHHGRGTVIVAGRERSNTFPRALSARSVTVYRPGGSRRPFTLRFHRIRLRPRCRRPSGTRPIVRSRFPLRRLTRIPTDVFCRSWLEMTAPPPVTCTEIWQVNATHSLSRRATVTVPESRPATTTFPSACTARPVNTPPSTGTTCAARAGDAAAGPKAGSTDPSLERRVTKALNPPDPNTVPPTNTFVPATARPLANTDRFRDASGARTARLSTIVVVRVVPGSADVTGPANDALHELIGAYAGRAIEAGSVPKIVGFDTPRHAVGFAVALVAACTQHGRQIATAVDIGEVADPIIDSDGGPVAAARRLAERAEPGEVLTSDVVRQLVGTYPGVRFIDQGRVRLPGRPDRARLWRIESSPQRRAAPATVGRDDELASLHELLSSLEGDTLLTRLVLFEGEAGIGKTHLLDRVRGYALDAGMLVVDARMDEVCSRVGTLPHAVLSVAERGDAYARRLAELLALVAHAETSDVSYSIVEATVDLADSLAAVQPVLVIADDLHWADELSLAVLRRIAPRVDSPAIGIVGAFRPAPRRPTLDLLIDGAMQHHVLRHHRLVGLGDADIVAMVAAQIGAAPGPKLRGSLTATAGSPLFVGALLQSLEDEGRLHIDGGVGEMVGEETPQALRDALLRRLSWLPVECRELLRIGSLLGGSFTLAELAAINHGATVVDTAATLREATAAGLLVGDGDRLAFRHDLGPEGLHGAGRGVCGL